MKRFLFFFACLFTLTIVPTAVFALDLGGSLAGEAAVKAGYSARTTETTFAETLGSVIQVALSFVGIIFTALMVYAGFLWMTARGDENMVEKSKKTLTTAVVGLVITLGSYSITAFVLPRVLERTTGDGGADNGLGGPEAPCCEVCTANSNINADDACIRTIIFSSDRQTDAQACQALCGPNGDKTCDYLGRIPRGQCN